MVPFQFQTGYISFTSAQLVLHFLNCIHMLMTSYYTANIIRVSENERGKESEDGHEVLTLHDHCPAAV